MIVSLHRVVPNAKVPIGIGLDMSNPGARFTYGVPLSALYVIDISWSALDGATPDKFLTPFTPISLQVAPEDVIQ